MNRTGIEYLDFTWNPIVGCFGVGCAVREHCWARAMARRQKNRCKVLCYSFIPHFHEERLLEPLERKKPSRIGVCFMGDFFDTAGSDYWRARVYSVIDSAPQHTFLILTKQPELIPPRWPMRQKWILPANLWIGVSVNCRADLWRLYHLQLRDQITLRFVSFEPLYEDMGDVDLHGIGWVIIGAQTRPELQPKREWVENLLRAAAKYGIPVFMKNNLRFPNLIQEFPKDGL